jgi:hypothetical protein
MYMNSDLVSAAVNDSRRRAEQLMIGLSNEQLSRRPDPSSWSIAECIKHLNLTGGLVQHIAKKAIAGVRPETPKGNGPYKLGARGRILVWVAEPPPKFPIRAPKSVAPTMEIPDPTQLLPEFMAVQDGWQRLMKDNEGLDLSKIKLGTFFSPFRCQLSGGIMWMMAHQRRHLCQAEKVKAEIVTAAYGDKAMSA